MTIVQDELGREAGEGGRINSTDMRAARGARRLHDVAIWPTSPSCAVSVRGLFEIERAAFAGLRARNRACWARVSVGLAAMAT